MFTSVNSWDNHDVNWDHVLVHLLMYIQSLGDSRLMIFIDATPGHHHGNRYVTKQSTDVGRLMWAYITSYDKQKAVEIFKKLVCSWTHLDQYCRQQMSILFCDVYCRVKLKLYSYSLDFLMSQPLPFLWINQYVLWILSVILTGVGKMN